MTDELAQERGADLWGEILIYGTLIGLSINEYKKSAVKVKQIKDEEAAVIAGIHASIAGVEKSLTDLSSSVADIVTRLQKLENTVNGREEKLVLTNAWNENGEEIEPTKDE